MAGRDTLAKAIVRPVDSAALNAYLIGLLGDRPRHSVTTPEARLEQARQALALLGQLSQKRTPVYDLKLIEHQLVQALFVPELAPAAAEVLGNLGTPGAQSALLDLANMGPARVESRQAAAAAFNSSIKRFGTLLTTGQVVHQYDRYNASEGESPEAQQLLASILDAIEERARSKGPDDPLGPDGEVN